MIFVNTEKCVVFLFKFHWCLLSRVQMVLSQHWFRQWLSAKQAPRGRLNIKMSSYQYRKSYCGDKTILRPSYLHNGISYTGKTASLYWIRAQAISQTDDAQWYLEPLWSVYRGTYSTIHKRWLTPEQMVGFEGEAWKSATLVSQHKHKQLRYRCT